MGTAWGAVALKSLEIMSNNKALEQQAEANNKTIQSMIQSMNYSFQNFEQSRRDAFEATISQLEKVKLQGNRQVSSVLSAVNEGIAGGGRTANLIVRSAQADVNRTTSSIKENYTKKMNEIDLNKEATLLNTKNQINAIPKVEAPSFLDTLLQLGTAYIGGKMTDEAVDLMRNKAGVDNIAGNVGFLNDEQLRNLMNFNPYQYYTQNRYMP